MPSLPKKTKAVLNPANWLTSPCSHKIFLRFPLATCRRQNQCSRWWVGKLFTMPKWLGLTRSGGDGTDYFPGAGVEESVAYRSACCIIFSIASCPTNA